MKIVFPILLLILGGCSSKPLPCVQPSQNGHWFSVLWQYRYESGKLCAVVQRDPIIQNQYVFFMYDANEKPVAQFPNEWDSLSDAMQAVQRICAERIR